MNIMKNDLYKKSICGLFVSGAVIIYGVIIFCKTFSFDLNTLLYAIKNLLITGIIFGILGAKIGEIIDCAYIKKNKKILTK